MTFYQPLMLAICALLPAYLIYVKNRNDLAVVWLALIIVLDIFNSQLYMNLSAILIFGSVSIPYLIRHRKELNRNSAIKVFALYFIYLSLLGLYYGFVNPWPDLTGLRSFKDQAQCRAILHLGRTFCEWSAILYLALQIEKDQRTTVSLVLKTIFFGAIVLALSALAEKYFQFDFYHFFTGGRELMLSDRPRGFAYEPRGLAQNLVYAILLTPFVKLKKWKYALIPFFAFVAIYFTISFTGMAILLGGIGLLAIVYAFTRPRGLKLDLRGFAFAVAATIGVFALLIILLPKTSTEHLNTRLDYLSQSNIAEKLEVFDAASINFLNHQPKHYVFGTGPGLIYLPAGDYIVARDRPIWGNHFEALPHMGLVLLLSNSGIIGLILFCWAIYLGVKSKHKTHPLLFAVGVLLVGLYFIQIRYFFVLGMACLLAFTHKPKFGNPKV
jgi:hypothetical protein